jgi:hypothetical protein
MIASEISFTSRPKKIKTKNKKTIFSSSCLHFFSIRVSVRFCNVHSAAMANSIHFFFKERIFFKFVSDSVFLQSFSHVSLWLFSSSKKKFFHLSWKLVKISLSFFFELFENFFVFPRQNVFNFSSRTFYILRNVHFPFKFKRKISTKKEIPA